MCHMSLTTIATATNPPVANSPTMQKRLIQKDPKKNIFFFCGTILNPF